MFDRHAVAGLGFCLFFVLLIDGSIEVLNRLMGVPRKEAVVWVSLAVMNLIGFSAIAGTRDNEGRRRLMSFTGRLWFVFWGNLWTYSLFLLACSEVVTRLGIRLMAVSALANCLGLAFVWRTPCPVEKTDVPYATIGFGLLIMAIGAEISGTITMSACYYFGISDLAVFGFIFAPLMFGVSMLILRFAQKQYQWR